MTSPPQRVLVVCPGCAVEYEAWYRASINLALGEAWSEEEIREATSARCPECGLDVDFPSLVLGEGGLWTLRGHGGDT